MLNCKSVKKKNLPYKLFTEISSKFNISFEFYKLTSTLRQKSYSYLCLKSFSCTILDFVAIKFCVRNAGLKEWKKQTTKTYSKVYVGYYGL